MNTQSLVLAAAGLAVCVLLPSRVLAAEGPAVDGSAIVAVIEEEKQAFLALDDARISATWVRSASSAKLYVFEGKETRIDGFAAIENHDRGNLAQERKLPPHQRAQFTFADFRVTQQGDSAWVTCHAQWSGDSAGSPLSGKQTRLYVLHRSADRWKIALMAIVGLAPDGTAAGVASASEHPRTAN
jgi:ketosteroid isomerase-like protein